MFLDSTQLILNSRQISGTLFGFDQVSRNRLRVMGLTKRAMDNLRNGAKFDLEHDNIKVGEITDVFIDSSDYSVKIVGTVVDSAVDLFNSGKVSHFSWAGCAVNVVTGKYITSEDIRNASMEDPIICYIDTIDSVGLVANPAHSEALARLTNNIKDFNTDDIKKLAFNFMQRKELILNSTMEDEVKPANTDDKSGGNEETVKPKEGEAIIAVTIKKETTKQETAGVEKQETVQNSAQLNGGVSITASQLRSLVSGDESSFTPKINNAEILFKKKQSELAQNLQNAILTTTSGISTLILPPSFNDFVAESGYLSAFCNVTVGWSEQPMTSVAMTDMPSLSYYDESQSDSLAENTLTFERRQLKPVVRVVFRKIVSKLELNSGVITADRLSMIMMKGIKNEITKAALIGKTTTSGLIKGVVSDSGLTPVAASGSWTYSDYQKLTKNRPYVANGLFTINTSQAEKYFTYLESKTGKTEVDTRLSDLNNFDFYEDYKIVGTARGKSIVVVPDAIIPVASNLTTTIYTGNRALNVRHSPIEVTVDITTRQSTDEATFTATCYVDAQLAHLSQGNYMTSVNVA